MKPIEAKKAEHQESEKPASNGKRGRRAFKDDDALKSNAFFDAIAMVFGRDPKEDEFEQRGGLEFHSCCYGGWRVHWEQFRRG